jgi:hypothetical protein
MPPQRDLLGLVDDAHPAPADLADDPVVAELLQGRRTSWLSASWTRRRVSALIAACDGVVSVPSNWAASETESGRGRPPR